MARPDQQEQERLVNLALVVVARGLATPFYDPEGNLESIQIDPPASPEAEREARRRLAVFRDQYNRDFRDNTEDWLERYRDAAADTRHLKF